MGWFDAEGIVQFPHIAVGPPYDHGGGQLDDFYGDVYISYHSQVRWNGIPAGFIDLQNPDGASGKVVFFRSTDGGVTWERSEAFGPGEADITWNRSTSIDNVPNTTFITGGSAQPWILPDPNNPGTIHVVAADDPDNDHGDVEDSRIYITTSTDNGGTWSDPQLIGPNAPSGSFQFFPTAAIDLESGCMAVLWYDNRLHQPNPSCTGHDLLDVFYSFSGDSGANWSAPAQINDSSLNPQLGSPCTGETNPGEYIGVALSRGSLYAVWTGNQQLPMQGYQTIFDIADGICGYCLGDLNNSGTVDAADLALLLGAWSEPENAPGCDGACPCAADLNGDGFVNAADLALLLGAWGACGSESESNSLGYDTGDWPPTLDCAADVNVDGVIDHVDLVAVCDNWGGDGATDANGDGTTNEDDIECILHSMTQPQ